MFFELEYGPDSEKPYQPILMFHNKMKTEVKKERKEKLLQRTCHLLNYLRVNSSVWLKVV